MWSCKRVYMSVKYIVFFVFFCEFTFPSFAEMGRFGGWSFIVKNGEPSAEQKKNSAFENVPESLSVDSKQRVTVSEQSTNRLGILYTAENKYKLPPVTFDKVYSDLEEDKPKFKIKPVNPINGLNIVETGTYLAN